MNSNGKRTPKRLFIGWDEPILSRAADLLVDKFGSEHACDMRGVLLVLPGGLAMRRLNELLVQKTQAAGKVLYPAASVTVGALPEKLYVARFPFAGDLVQQLAWVQALRSIEPAQLHGIVPVPPPRNSPQQWLELAKMLTGLHREIASDRIDFGTVAHKLGSHPEAERWHALADVQKRYWELLDKLELWDIQTARVKALEFGEARTEQQLIVIGCVDLNATQRGFLNAVASQVEVWVAAPESAAAQFDPDGCLVPDRWREQRLALEGEQILVGDSPQDQAELVSASLAGFGDRYHVRDVTIGVPDSSLVDEIKFELDQCSLRARYGPGTQLAASEPVRLLGLIAKYNQNRLYQDFAALIRHPAMSNVLRPIARRIPENWLSEIDNYYREVIPKQVDGFVNDQARGAKTYRLVTKRIGSWLSQLPNRDQPLSHWVAPLLSALEQAYSKEVCRLDDLAEGPLYSAAKSTCAAICSLQDVAEELEPSLTLVEVTDWLVRSISGQLIPAPPDSQAVEMLGWLELALDDAPVLVIAGMHDGVVPESVNSDSFLPNGLRQQLGLMDNARRYARDCYSLQVILNTRAEVRIVVGRSDASGDPLVPSRLLMACDLPDLPSRVLHLVGDDVADVPESTLRRWQPTDGPSQLEIPKPKSVKPPETITVTAFRDYLACPYRFYLKHVLRLRTEEDSAAELDAAGFGVMLHDTLDLFGRSQYKDSTDPDELRDYLIKQLHQLAAERYGKHPPATILIQIEQAEERLTAFAPQQAARAADGWEIRHVEAKVEAEHNILLGAQGSQLKLVGRIDRIDFHPDSGQWAIWDYKTSGAAKAPVSVHWKKSSGWIDLQLPLYIHLSRALKVTGTPLLGYIALPKQARDTGFRIAEFTAEQLAEADSIAGETATAIAQGAFWPGEIEPVRFDDFERICQTGVERVDAAAPVRRPHRYQAARLQGVNPDLFSQAELLAEQPGAKGPSLPAVIIRASAGTGKTFQLSNRLLQIILSGQPVDSILATTFTRKAAGEIMHRVLQRLARACMTEEARIELQNHVTDVDTSQVALLGALRRLTQTVHRLRIGTLDSFFAQIARAFTLELGLPPGWSTMDPLAEPGFQMEAIGRTLNEHDRKRLVTLVRMLAKGESTRQVADQVRQTVGAGYGAFRNTGKEAWDQLPLPKPPSEAAIDSALLTLQSASVGNKSADRHIAALHHSASIGDWEKVIMHGIYNRIHDDVPTYYRKELPQDLIDALLLLSDRAAAELLPIRRNQTLASYDLLEAYDQQYNNLLKSQRSLAFSDITYYLAEAAGGDRAVATEDQARKQSLDFRLDCGVDHLLLDEFQDTAPEQWRVLRPLAQPLGGQPEFHKSFFCVGDTKQAIYGWRGGVAEIFDTVAGSVPDVATEQLQKSYRSSGEVIDAVNHVFLQLPRHSNMAGCDEVAKTWSQRFPKHDTAKRDLTGYVCLKNNPTPASGLTAEEKKALTLGAAADQIAELTRQSSASVGVLFRTNADVGRMISLLRQRAVSASQDGGNPLTDSAPVQLLLSLVHLADHPGDSSSAFHVLASPLGSFLKSAAGPSSSEISVWVRRQVSRRGLALTLARVADQLADKLSWWDQHRVKQLIRSAQQFEGSGVNRLRDFEESVINDRVALPTDAQVKVMTVHRSKGLEFEAVFLPELEIDLASSNSLLVLRGQDPCEPPDGVLRYMNASLQAMLPETWQTAFADHRGRQVVESLCLLYVAMTRARRALYMFTRPTKSGPTQQLGSLLQSTLGAEELTSEPDAVLYQQGDPQWHQAFPKKTETDEAATGDAKVQQAMPQTKVRLRTDRDTAPQRSLRVSAPSSLHQFTDSVPLANAFSFSSNAGAIYGTVMHALFEQVTWIEQFQCDRDRLRNAAMAAATPDELQHISIDQIIDQFEELLQTASIKDALCRAQYDKQLEAHSANQIEVDNERPVSVIAGEQLINGTIDRLVLLLRDGRPYAAEIIDFKTDRFDENVSLIWLEERISHHRPQLDTYASVVEKLFGIPRSRIRARLVMLATCQVADCPLTQGSGSANLPSPDVVMR